MTSPTFTVTREHAGGTCLRGYATFAYADLVRVLGEPSKSDGYKVSTEWTLVGDDGSPWTIYDYKATSLYGEDLPSVRRFRKRASYDWHIGGRTEDDAKTPALVAWLKARIAELPAQPPPEKKKPKVRPIRVSVRTWAGNRMDLSHPNADVDALNLAIETLVLVRDGYLAGQRAEQASKGGGS